MSLEPSCDRSAPANQHRADCPGPSRHHSVSWSIGDRFSRAHVRRFSPQIRSRQAARQTANVLDPNSPARLSIGGAAISASYWFRKVISANDSFLLHDWLSALPGERGQLLVPWSAITGSIDRFCRQPAAVAKKGYSMDTAQVRHPAVLPDRFPLDRRSLQIPCSGSAGCEHSSDPSPVGIGQLASYQTWRRPPVTGTRYANDGVHAPWRHPPALAITVLPRGGAPPGIPVWPYEVGGLIPRGLCLRSGGASRVNGDPVRGTLPGRPATRPRGCAWCQPAQRCH